MPTVPRGNHHGTVFGERVFFLRSRLVDAVDCFVHSCVMKPPRLPDQYPDRHLDCQESLEDRFAALVDDGLAAGWSLADITVALVALADHRMLADAENRKTNAQIEAALRKLGL